VTSLLTIAGAVFLVAQVGFLVYGHRNLGALSAGLSSASLLAAGILQHRPWLIGVSVLGIAVFLLWFWWGGPKRRSRVRKELGDESRQVRDELAEKGRARPGPSPSPQP
jgi:membrane protein implicated in regulation of membrane protease activity